MATQLHGEVSHFHKCPKCKKLVPGYAAIVDCKRRAIDMCGKCTGKMFPKIKREVRFAGGITVMVAV